MPKITRYGGPSIRYGGVNTAEKPATVSSEDFDVREEFVEDKPRRRGKHERAESAE